MLAAAHHRFWANGRSRLTVRIATFPGRPAASWLKRRVSVSQTGVSSDGTALRILTFPRKSASVTWANPVSTTRKSGALSPTLTSGPSRVIGFPLNVMIPFRSCMATSMSGFALLDDRKGKTVSWRKLRVRDSLSARPAPRGPPGGRGQDLRNHPLQLLDAVRLPEHPHEPVGGVVRHHRVRGVAAADDDLRLGVHSRQARARFPAPHLPGHRQVHDDQVERGTRHRGFPVHPDRLAAVRRPARLETEV